MDFSINGLCIFRWNIGCVGWFDMETQGRSLDRIYCDGLGVFFVSRRAISESVVIYSYELFVMGGSLFSVAPKPR